ncbi:helix-turn-helix domain-containing protein [Hoyosella sp. YIM 151337]|nr:helix-turn-helix domain-containing protein [Hoyosella sp. YIM 151337]
MFAEPRDEFEARARARRTRAIELRRQGKKYREIAEELSCPIGTVGRMLNLAKQRGEL